MLDPEYARITNRHIAKTLATLEQIDVADVIKDVIKKRMWFLCNDLFDESLRKNNTVLESKERGSIDGKNQL